MATAYITSKELASILNISTEALIDIEVFFDSDPNDQWDLVEGKDYRIVNISSGLREYTETGAYTIAEYIELEQSCGLWDKIKEWFSKRKKKIRQAFVRKRITENSSSLVKRSDSFFVSKSDAVKIFGTRPSYLSKVIEEVKKGGSLLILEEDYIEIFEPGASKASIYFSLSGLYKLSEAFERIITKKNRKAWCKDVGEVIFDQVDKIVGQIKKRDSQIKKAKLKAKERDSFTCQITRKRANKINSHKMAAHHLYSQSEYPILASSIDNLITLSCEVHEQFHQHMGGNSVPCTIDDLENFIQVFYPESTEVLVWLQQQKLCIQVPPPVSKRNRHVLHLPASRVS